MTRGLTHKPFAAVLQLVRVAPPPVDCKTMAEFSRLTFGDDRLVDNVVPMRWPAGYRSSRQEIAEVRIAEERRGRR